jgi:hypothetical protein
VLLVESGPLDIFYYQSLLNPLFANSNAEIIKVIKHNSPNELIIQGLDIIQSFTPIIALFLATRVKLEIRDISDKVLSKIKQYFPDKVLDNANIEKKDSLSISNIQDNSELEIIYRKSELSQNIKMKAAFPDGKNDLYVELNLNHDSKIICSIGKTVITILN